MATTLTIRADPELRQALRQRASAQGRSVSEVVREILRQALAEKPLKDKAGHMKSRSAPSTRPPARVRDRKAEALAFLEREVWSEIPSDLLGRGVSKQEREEILGYGPSGV